MGLLDIFKKKPADKKLPEKCSECFRPINGYVWNLDNKKYCQECYNRKMSIVQQIAGQSSEEHDFEMTIEDVFFIKNHGVVVTGRIHRGVIHRNDVVTINGSKYTVTLIDVIPNQVEYAKEGTNVGLHLSTMNSGAFKRGDVVTSKRFESTPQKYTFICDVCKNEFPIKYKHNDNTCVKCAEARKEQNTHRSENVRKNNFCLGTFNFTEEDRQSLKAAAMRYLPPKLDTAEAQLVLLQTLSLVMEISVVKLKTEFSWNIPESMPNEMKKERFTSALVETILSVDQTLSFLNPDSLIKKVDSANAEELLKSWIVLDYYAHTLKPEHTLNIQHFRDYIHNTIQTKFSKATPEKIGIPVKFDGTNIYIDSNAFLQWKNSNILTPQYELNGVLPLEDKEPVICLFEDGTKTREYVLQTTNDEDFSGKYFLISVRLGIQGNPAVPVAQIDGFVSDTPEERKMTMNDVGYRFEGHFLACGGEEGKKRCEMNRGQDLHMKALKYQGYTTPSNVRLIGVCPDCGKSFCFHGYAFYMAQSDIAYSDDGLDCCELQAYDIDKDTWSYETEGKCFRYYNSFNCPHCGTPYIDYKKYPENKVFGVSGCVLLGKKHYQFKSKEENTPKKSENENLFKMTVNDVFYVTDKGVILEGKINKGTINRNDKVSINGRVYTVAALVIDKKFVIRASEGSTVGMMVDSHDKGLFHPNDVVSGIRQDQVSNSTPQHKVEPTVTPSSDEYLNDITFIRDMKHIPTEPWHQYDVLLAARGYGWDLMKEWADYMSVADLEHISQITTGSLGTQENDITNSYTNNGYKCKNTPELDREMGFLSIAGISKTLKAPMKIVWINQTQVLRFFTLVNNDLLIKKYAETTIRRTFNTDDAMKLGKPLPKEQ